MSASSEQSKKIRALIVDDSPLTLELMRSYLNELPFVEVVGAAESGTGALKLAPTLKPDFVLTDLRMPGMDGLELARKLGEICPKIQVILATVEDNELLQRAARQNNVRAIVLKDRLHEDLLRQMFLIFPERR